MKLYKNSPNHIQLFPFLQSSFTIPSSFPTFTHSVLLYVFFSLEPFLTWETICPNAQYWLLDYQSSSMFCLPVKVFSDQEPHLVYISLFLQYVAHREYLYYISFSPKQEK